MEAELRANRLDLLYVAPELLLGERTLGLLTDFGPRTDIRTFARGRNGTFR